MRNGARLSNFIIIGISISIIVANDDRGRAARRQGKKMKEHFHWKTSITNLRPSCLLILSGLAIVHLSEASAERANIGTSCQSNAHFKSKTEQSFSSSGFFRA